MALGQIIRNRRESKGLTLDKVSGLCNYSKPYLSTIETGRVKNPPADELLIKLEEILDFEKGLLLHIAHMERMPVDIRKVFEDSQAEVAHLKSIIRSLVRNNSSAASQLANGNENSSLTAETCHQTAGKLVPVINSQREGYPKCSDNGQYPLHTAKDYLRCPDLHDPKAFAIWVVDDSMEPKYNKGDIVIFSPQAKVSDGDDCFVNMRSNGNSQFKRIYFEKDSSIRLQPLNYRYPADYALCKSINRVSKAIMKYQIL